MGDLRGGRVRNAWASYPPVGDTLRKRGIIPHTLRARVGVLEETGDRPVEVPAGD